MAKITKSIEEKIEDWCKKQFKGQKYYTKTEAINPEIEIALNKAPSRVVPARITLTSNVCFSQRMVVKYQ